MDKTRIFVSSTCFDLSQIRRDMEDFIKSMEYEPIMSDSKNISIPPGLDNIEACKWLVRGSDIFVLIIGGRYGSTHSESGKSITNIEYDTAYESGMPIYTFVDNEVWIQREIYNRLKEMVAAGEIPEEKIKNALGAKIEDPRVFEFINRVSSSQRDQWIHPFSQGSEIIETLKRNWSLYFKQLLKTRKGDESFLYQTKLLPSLSLRWADSEGTPLETLSVKPLPRTSLNKEEIIKQLKNIRPDDGDLKFIREKTSTILKLLIEREPEEIGLLERVDEGFISSAQDFAKRIDSALELINSNIYKFGLFLNLKGRCAKPNFLIYNGGNCPAQNIVVYLNHGKNVVFLDEKDVDEKNIIIYEEVPKSVSTLMQLSKDLDKYLRLPPVERYKQPAITSAVGNALAMYTGSGSLRYTGSFSSVPNLSDKKLEVKLEDKRIRIDYDGNLKHGFQLTVGNSNIYFLSGLKEGESEDIKFECYADNLPIPKSGFLRIVAKE